MPGHWKRCCSDSLVSKEQLFPCSSILCQKINCLLYCLRHGEKVRQLTKSCSDQCLCQGPVLRRTAHWGIAHTWAQCQKSLCSDWCLCLDQCSRTIHWGIAHTWAQCQKSLCLDWCLCQCSRTIHWGIAHCQKRLCSDWCLCLDQCSRTIHWGIALCPGTVPRFLLGHQINLCSDSVPVPENWTRHLVRTGLYLTKGWGRAGQPVQVGVGWWVGVTGQFRLGWGSGSWGRHFRLEWDVRRM